MSPLNQIVGDYLQAFVDKNIDKLVSLLAENVELRDWTLREKGINSVRSATLQIFKSCTTIEVLPVHVLIGEKNAIAELIIRFDDNEPIHVVDVYDFDDDGKIVAIRAYKG